MAEVKLTELGEWSEGLEQTITALQGHLLNSIELGKVKSGYNKNEDIVIFNTSTGKFVVMHDRDCCEDVKYLNTSGILLEQHDIKSNNWTIKEAKLQSQKIKHNTGDITEVTTLLLSIENIEEYEYQAFLFSWLGSSNGYYSTGVDLFRIDEVSEESWENSEIEVVSVLWKSLE